MKRDGMIDEEVDGSLQGQVTRRATNDDDAGLVSLLQTLHSRCRAPEGVWEPSENSSPSDNAFTSTCTAHYRLHHLPTPDVRPFWVLALFDCVPARQVPTTYPECGELSSNACILFSFNHKPTLSIVYDEIRDYQTVLFLSPLVFQMLLRIPSHLDVAPTRQII
jgi:hypothetical protein